MVLQRRFLEFSARSVSWMFGVLLETEARRDGLMQFLAAREVETRTFFLPMNRQPVYKTAEPFPVAELRPVTEEWMTVCNIDETECITIASFSPLVKAFSQAGNYITPVGRFGIGSNYSESLRAADARCYAPASTIKGGRPSPQPSPRRSGARDRTAPCSGS
jgi:hypothetical protein